MKEEITYIKKITYTTIDGEKFDSELAALKHENAYLLKNKQIINNDDGKENFLKEIPETSGVYLWTCIKEGYKPYVGSGINLKKRAIEFLSFKSSYSGKKINDARQKYNKLSYWHYTVLKFCKEEDLEYFENLYINVFDSINNGYNSMTSVRKDNVNIKGFLPQSNTDILNINIDVINSYERLKTSYPMTRDNNHYSFKKLITLEDYNNQLLQYKIIPQSGKSIPYFKIKHVHNNSSSLIDIGNLSIIPIALQRLINSTKRSVFDEEGFPSVTIKKVNQNEYMYSFSCINHYDIPITKSGFDNKRDCYKSLIIAKAKISKKICEEYRQFIDDDTYDIINTLTLEEAERLFFSNIKQVFSNTEECNTLIYDLEKN